MSKDKIWKVRGKSDTYTDEELIEAIKNGKLSKKDAVTTKDMKTWVVLKNSIYQFYFNEGETNETI